MTLEELETVEECMACPDLDGWEVKFLQNLFDEYEDKPLSFGQKDRLSKIAEKLES